MDSSDNRGSALTSDALLTVFDIGLSGNGARDAATVYGVFLSGFISDGGGSGDSFGHALDDGDGHLLQAETADCHALLSRHVGENAKTDVGSLPDTERHAVL